MLRESAAVSGYASATMMSADFPKRARTALPELDWTQALQQQHRYRCWVWSASDLATVGLALARIARGLALEAVLDWCLEPLADDTALCVAELIGNAMTHGCREGHHPALSLGLRYFPTCCLLLEVGDPNPAPPLLPSGAQLETSDNMPTDGRGLVIIRELADHLWWRRQGSGGKIVYARLDTPRYFAPLAGGHRG
ncbi:ATP-binding protein [Streptacidiphilus anmyonensis]|uniref:ATP-binding protein n=1 Tax=Streptacidiphilus anmyonensis TaxID=405782 RepID=UPI0005AA9829|nr:ATP-binding protein [Streptacidiphilus anmyonensis]